MKNNFIKSLALITVSLVGIGSLTTLNNVVANDNTLNKVQEFVSDSTLTMNIKKQIFANNKLKILDIGVKTINGTVTLTGAVPDISTREMVIQLVKDTNGVNAVVNKINIGKGQAVNKVISDNMITAKIKLKLLEDEQLEGIKIHLETTNSEVTLSGVVVNEEDIRRAIAIAETTNGVTKVVSNLYVRKIK